MFRNGIYKIFYRDPIDEEGPFEDALAVVTAGAKVGQWSGGLVLSRGGVKSGHPIV